MELGQHIRSTVMLCHTWCMHNDVDHDFYLIRLNSLAVLITYCSGELELCKLLRVLPLLGLEMRSYLVSLNCQHSQ